MRVSRRTLLGGLSTTVAGLTITNRARSTETDPRLSQRWVCRGDQCRPYIYDPRLGDADGGIPPMTAFEDIPDDWYCPICGYGKEVFVKLTPALEKAIQFHW